jgi:hypothetical protein
MDVSIDRLLLEQEARAWADDPDAEAKLEQAPDLFLRLINAFRFDQHQDLANDQISKALAALRRYDTATASNHLRMALIGVPHADVAIEWDDLVKQTQCLIVSHSQPAVRRAMS